MTMLQDTNKPSRRWCFTWNNPGDAVPDWACNYLCYAKEIGESGTPHWQGYCVFATVKRLSAMKKINNTIHWEIARGTTDDSINYCSKDGILIEVGERPKSRKEVGEDNHARWLDVIRSARQGTCDEEYPKEFVTYNSAISRMNEIKPPNLSDVCGIWIYGPTGTGKSYAVEQAYPDAFIKDCDKWWPNYAQEEVVVMEEAAPEHVKELGYRLKHWAGNKRFYAEWKGGGVYARPNKFIVTSNYSILEMGFRQNDFPAICRRFVEIYKDKKEQVIDFGIPVAGPSLSVQPNLDYVLSGGDQLPVRESNF